MLWRLDAFGRFLLERMDYPNFLAKLYGVDQPEGIGLEGQSYLEHARAKALHRFRYIRLAAVGCDRQRGQANDPCSFRKSLEVPERRLQPGNGTGLAGSAIR